jgi:undecaprenyl-diphosphatase
MLTVFQAISIGLLQGVTELFPISSLGHSVLLPAIFKWNLDQESPTFLVFLVATHLATALVLFLFYLRDWIAILQGLLRSVLARRVDPRDTFAKLGVRLIVATVPAGLLGLLFQKKLAVLFASPHIVAVFLFLNGVLLLFAERAAIHSRRLQSQTSSADVTISRMPLVGAFMTGTAQALALLPGFSRTGASLAGGLYAGLDHVSAIRFSFLLATPIIFAAALLKLPVLFTPGYPVAPILIGSLASALTAFLSVLFLTRYFKNNTLRPFAYYCMLAGAGSLIYFLIGA